MQTSGTSQTWPERRRCVYIEIIRANFRSSHDAEFEARKHAGQACACVCKSTRQRRQLFSVELLSFMELQSAGLCAPLLSGRPSGEPLAKPTRERERESNVELRRRRWRPSRESINHRCAPDSIAAAVAAVWRNSFFRPPLSRVERVPKNTRFPWRAAHTKARVLVWTPELESRRARARRA